MYVCMYEYFPRELVRPVNSCSPKNPWGYETHRDFRWWNSPLCKGGTAAFDMRTKVLGSQGMDRQL